MPPPRDRRRFDDEDEDYDRPRRRRRDDDEDEDDEDDRPRRKRQRATGSNGMATAALVLGVLSLCFGVLTGIPAAVCGVLGLSKANQVGTGKGMAIAGIVLGVLGTILTAAAGYFAYRGTQEVVNKVEQAAGSMKASNDLKEIGLHAHHFHDERNVFAGPYHRPANGTVPTDAAARLSWRYTLLPYAGEDLLAKRFTQDQAWDSPANRSAANTPVALYCASEGPTSTQTRYRVFVGGGALFDADPPAPKGAAGPPRLAQPPRIVNITDGLSNTIYAAEAADTVPWAQHNELWFDPKAPLLPLGRPGRDTFLVLMCDGSTRIVKKSVNPETLKMAITRAGGEIQPPDW